MSPVSVARLTARQEHTLSPHSPVSPTFGQTAFKFRELFSAFSRSAATPHQSRRQGGALSPASVSVHFVGKGPLFYKKTSPISFPYKPPPFHLLPTALYSRQRSGLQSSTIRRLPLAAFLLLGAACQLARLRFLLARSRCSGAGTGRCGRDGAG